MWTTSGPAPPGNYSFAKSWRYYLPGVISYSLGSANLLTPEYKIVSYRTSFNSIDTSGANITMEIVNVDAAMIYMLFSVIVITENNNYVELISLSSYMPSTSSNTHTMQGTSTKFSFGNAATEPYSIRFHEWVISAPGFYNVPNYWSQVFFDKFAGTSNFQFRYWTGNNIMMAGAKAVLLLVTQNVAGVSVVHFNSESIAGNTTTNVFSVNLGVSTANFGYPRSSPNCVIGLLAIDPYIKWPSTNTPYKTMFLFNYPFPTTNPDYIDIPLYDSMWYVKFSTSCFGLCPTGQLFINGACTPQCPIGCATCDATKTTCTSCLSLYYLRTDGLCYATCLERFFANNSTKTCDACPVSCVTCVSTSQCLTCDPLYFLRPGSMCYTSCLIGSY